MIQLSMNSTAGPRPVNVINVTATGSDFPTCQSAGVLIDNGLSIVETQLDIGLKSGFISNLDYKYTVQKQESDTMSERSPNHRSHPDNTRHNERRSREHEQQQDRRDNGYQHDPQRRLLTEPVRYPGAEFLAEHQRSDHHQSDYHDRSYREPATQSERWPAPERVEEVWMKEKSGKITFNDSDLQDVAYPKFSGGLSTTLAGAAGVTAMLALIGFLALSSLPDLSPQEIIAMEGYGGEQATKTPFNLASLRDCNDVHDCAEPIDTAITTSTNSAQTAPVAPVVYTDEVLSDELPIADTTPLVVEPPAATQAEFTELQEIPAATSLAAIVTTFDEAPVADQLTVLRQWSNVRSSPNTNGAILTSLARGTDVTLLRQTGDWFEVSVFDRREIIGYMHRSTVTTQ